MDLHGNFGMYSTNTKRPKVPKRLEKKVLKHFIKTGFLHFTIEPFQEFNPDYSNIFIDPEITTMINGFLFSNYLSQEQMD